MPNFSGSRIPLIHYAMGLDPTGNVITLVQPVSAAGDEVPVCDANGNYCLRALSSNSYEINLRLGASGQLI